MSDPTPRTASAPPPSTWASLRRDPMIRLGAVVFAAVVLPYLAPVFGPARQAVFAEGVQPVLLVLTIAAIRFGLAKIPTSSERLFWNLWTAAFGVWLLADVVDQFVPAPSVLEMVFFTCFYAIVAWALESRAHLPRDRGEDAEPLGSFASGAAVIFAFSLVVYFTAIPALLDRESYLTFVPTYLFYSIFDVYIVLRLLSLRRACRTPRWRAIYSWLWVMAILWAIGDQIDVFSYLGAYPPLDWGKPYDLLWVAPYAAALLAVRVREHRLEAPENDPARELRWMQEHRFDSLGLAPPILFAMCFLVIHFFFAISATAAPAVVEARNVWALLVLLSLAGLALIQSRVLNRTRLRAEQGRRQSEARFRTLFEHASEAIVVYDLDQDRLVDANQNAVELFGREREELLTLGPSQLGAPGQSDWRPEVERMRADADAAALASATAALEWQCAGPGGDPISCEVRLCDLPSANNSLVRASIIDVSARKQLEEQLGLSRRMEAVGMLAGGIAHDFNNLLTAIIGHTELALTGEPDDTNVDKDLEVISLAADRAALLTRQLLAFSREQVLHPRVVNLNTVVAGIEPLLDSTLGDDVELVIYAEPELAPVKVDPGEMEQVLLNLALNARDAMPRGGRFTLETRNLAAGERVGDGSFEMEPGPLVALSASDVGVGMDEDLKRRAFEPFFTTKRREQGTGLGLAMVYGIVRQSGGHIWLQSVPGQGSTFTIYLRAVEEEIDSVDKDLDPSVRQPRSETILLVEDNAQVRTLVQKTLRSEGYTVLAAEDGSKALEVFASHPEIEMLLSDVVMPGMAGPELASRLAEARPDLKVLLMSGYAHERLRTKGLENPEVPVLKKPFSPSELRSKISEVLDSGGPPG